MNIPTLSFGGYNFSIPKNNKNNPGVIPQLNALHGRDVFFGNAPDAIRFDLGDVITAFQAVAASFGKSLQVLPSTEMTKDEIGRQARNTVDNFLFDETVAKQSPMFNVYKNALILTHLVQLLDRKDLNKVTAGDALSLLEEEYPGRIPAITKTDMGQMLITAGYPSNH